jgi:hypothetical protein
MNIARNDAASMRTRASFLEAMHTHSITAGRRLDNVYFFFVMIVHLVLRNTDPA